MLAAGAAALAIASPGIAEKGGHSDKGQGHPAKAQQGGGQKAAHGKGGGGQMRFAQRDEAKSKGGEHAKVKAAVAHGPDRPRVAKAEHGNQGKVRQALTHDADVVRIDRDKHDRIVRLDRDDRADHLFAPRWGEHGLVRGFVDGCPPGLAKKNNGCLPPGQAKKIVGTTLSRSLAASALGWPYRQWYPDNDRFIYRSDADYIYRVRRDNNLIDALFPYANRDFYYYPVGLQYPPDYNYYNVPYQYQAFYPDGGDNWYRYGDGAIYMVDPQTQAISGIAALLTGTPMGIGQPLPPAYSVYNVPLGYRAQYYDTPDAWYRYNDGYIYRVDPATSLITAVISALV
jgi:hypothetical protein